MGTINRLQQEIFCLLTGFFCLAAVWTTEAVAEDSFCATVKIEIRQELTLERQAFDAHMRINNGLTHIALTDLTVTISFADEEGNTVEASSDPDNTTARFFIRADSGSIGDWNSGGGFWPIGDVPAATSSDLHWLIIPAPGSAGDRPEGKIYFVGARLTYTMGGQEHVTEVSPDYIFVKPLPLLALDYFLTNQVYGDDAFTPEVEPSVPFTLGVRVRNNGHNTAYNLNIDSAQPKIIENEHDLLVGFSIIGSEVNGVTAANRLLVSLGDIAPGKAAVGRWLMTCSLSGEFTEFSAGVSHADELGGQLTSIIENDPHTAALVRDVRADLPGRDAICDFLARDGDVLRVYESECAAGSAWETTVVDYSSGALFDNTAGDAYRLYSFSPAAGEFIYVKVADPFNEQKNIKEVIRSDGKRIKAENAWLSRERKENPADGWNYFVNIFDAASTGDYRVVFDDVVINQPPVFDLILGQTGVEGQPLAFDIRATDPEGVTPQLSVSNLPAGAGFTDHGAGTGAFAWTPAAGQAGSYSLFFRATDGQAIVMQVVPLTIHPAGDGDGDGMDDAWEMEHFGALDRDGAGDFDGDGISDLDEFRNGTDPTRAEHGPSAPAIVSPVDGQEVTGLSPTLIINNSVDPDGDALTYEFEVYSDARLTQRMADVQNVAETPDTTAWTVSPALADNTLYYWRTRAFDGVAYSLWTYGTFFVNTANDAPGPLHISRPVVGSYTDTVTPVLEVTNSTDADRDVLTYDFEVYADGGLTTAIATAAGVPAGPDGVTAWTVDTALTDGSLYFWRAAAVDPHGGRTTTVVGSFTVSTANRAPTAPAIIAPADSGTVTDPDPEIVVANAVDPDNDLMVYDFQADTVRTFDGPERIVAEGIIAGAGATAWQATGLAGNTTWFWRARAFDGQAYGPWVTGRFFVNPANDAPSAPTLKNPGDYAWVDTLTPELSVNPAPDPDGDAVVYHFEAYADSGLDTLVFEGSSSQPRLVVSSGLADNTRYYWRAMAEDPDGAVSEWTAAATFHVAVMAVTDTTPPVITASPAGGIYAEAQLVTLNADEPAFIYYTLDGTTPDEGSIIYLSPFVISWPLTLKCLGIDASGNRSEIVTEVYAFAPTDLTVIVTTSAGSPVADVNVYTFTGSGSYTGLHSQTDADGAAQFTPDDFAAGTYRFRVDYLGSQFWTETIPMPGTLSVEKVIPVQTVEVTVTTAAGAFEGVPVYLFTDGGAYLGLQATTGADGRASFTLPVGESYLFRTDILSGQYWSETITVSAEGDNPAPVDAGGGEWTVYVKKDGLWPMENIRAYLFRDTGAYLNINGLTDMTGAVSFAVPEGTYKVRADYLGYQFWTGDAAVSDDTALDLDIFHQDVAIYLAGVYQGMTCPMEDISVYLFTEAGAYMSLNRTTGDDGRVTFNLPERAYKARADYLGRQFWSGAFTWQDRTIEIPMAEAEITVIDGVPLASVPVYVFTEAGVYLGISGATDADGKALFRLPAGAYQFRADYQNNQFWSGTAQLTADQNNPVTIRTGGGFFSLTVMKDAAVPLAGVPCYAFNDDGAYLGLTNVTDGNGQVGFELSDGDYRFRADYLGYPFWTDVRTVPDVLQEILTIPHQDTTVTVDGVYQGTAGPLAGINTYLFTGSGTYMNRTQTTNTAGKVSFNLPEQPYRVRADYLSRSYWSDIFTWQDKTINIPMAEAEISVTGNGQPRPGVPVYVFTGAGVYLNISAVTGADGLTVFRLPAGNYKFRADYQGSQYWSAVFSLTADQGNTIPVSTGGGSFTLTILKNATDALVGAKCYLFTGAGTYLNLSAVTSSEGQVSFNVADGNYKIRVDHLGYRFWTGVFVVPDTLSEVLTIPHQNLTVSVMKDYQGQTPLAGIPVYLFKPFGEYLSQNRATDADGRAVFNLPDQAYRVRADYLGNQFWSVDFQSADTAVAIPHNPVNVHVHRSGADAAGAVVYLFTGGGAYLGRSQAADVFGLTAFVLPEGRSFKFRADQGGDQVYSSVITVPADQEQLVEIDLD